jgi:hypothetical protein
MNQQFKLTFVTALISTISYAQPFSFLRSLEPMLQSRPLTHDCKNFSGTWKGSCTMTQPLNVPSPVETFVLDQQGCESITVSSSASSSIKIPLPIGGTVSVGGAVPGTAANGAVAATPAKSFGASVDSSWDMAHNVLTIYVVGGGKALAIDSAPKGFVAKEDIQLVADNKLTVTITGQGGAGSCEFDKQ